MGRAARTPFEIASFEFRTINRSELEGQALWFRSVAKSYRGTENKPLRSLEHQCLSVLIESELKALSIFDAFLHA